MSCVLDETAADLPVRDMSVHLSRLAAAAPPDASVQQHARERLNVGKLSREELEDRFLRVHEEALQLKQHIHKQDEKIKRLGTKLMKLVKDRGRMEQLAAGAAAAPPPPRLRDVETEEAMEELQDKVRGLRAQNEELKQRLLVAKQQLLSSHSRRPTPYRHVPPRVNAGPKRLRDDSASPSPGRPRSRRSLEGGGGAGSGQLPRYGHSLLEEARARILSLEGEVESQRSHAEQLEAAEEQLRAELRRKEAELEEKLLQARQQQNSTLRSQVSSSASMIRLRKQLDDRAAAVTELEERYLLLQEAQRTMKASNDAAMAKVDELTTRLKDEQTRSRELEQRLETAAFAMAGEEQLKERITELEQDKELLKESNEKLMSRAFDVSQQQRWQLQEQQLKLQIAQLEAALKADLVDKNQILDRIQSECNKNQQLTEENQRLQVQFVEQKQRVEELEERLAFYSREKDYSAAELTEALLLIRRRKSQSGGALSFLEELDEDGSSTTDSSVRELRAAHAETIQELEKTRNLLSTESRISQGYKAELEAALRRMSGEEAESEQKLQRQAQLLDARAAKISKLEAQLQTVAYGGTRSPALAAEAESRDAAAAAVPLEPGESLLELQIAGASLSAAALRLLGDPRPSTFCTYRFYLFDPHATPVAAGRSPRYGFTSRYALSLDGPLLEYLRGGSLTVELHQALGLDWRTLAAGTLRLQRLLEPDGALEGSVPLVGTHEDARNFGSLDYRLRLRLDPGHAHSAGSGTAQPIRNELLICVHRCRDLRPRGSTPPSPYVVYRFLDFPDHPTATVDDCGHPEFGDRRSYPVLMDRHLDGYLSTQRLRFYVFDYKEEQMDAYLGKAQVPLLPLTRDQQLSGVFELTDPSGRAAGRLEVALSWKLPYCPTEQRAAEPADPCEGRGDAAERTDGRLEDEDETQRRSTVSKGALPGITGQKTAERDGGGAKRVTFQDVTPAAEQFCGRSLADRPPEEKKKTALRVPDVQEASEAPQTKTEEDEDEEEEEEEEEESHVSEGQLVQAALPDSDDSDIAEEIIQDAAPPAAAPQRDSAHSDSDDCIVQGAAAGRKRSERLLVEVVSLSLAPGCRLMQDDSVVRLFVEYNFLDLPTEETPLSLPKPAEGRSLNFNYSKVIPVDAENNAARRRLLRDILQGRNAPMERIRFTVVSEPPEEEEQERECEDVGVANLRIPEVLENQEDLMEARLRVLDVEDSSQLLGHLTVSMEGLQALRAVLEDQDLD